MNKDEIIKQLKQYGSKLWKLLNEATDYFIHKIPTDKKAEKERDNNQPHVLIRGKDGTYRPSREERHKSRKMRWLINWSLWIQKLGLMIVIIALVILLLDLIIKSIAAVLILVAIVLAVGEFEKVAHMIKNRKDSRHE